MAPEKAPAYQFYPRDYADDEAVKLMTYEQEGVYRRLLDHQWTHGGLPADVSHVALLVPKISKPKFLKLWPAIAEKFPIVNGRRVNPRMERQRADTDAFKRRKSDAGKAGAERKWGPRNVA